jgi:hypothetical protein
MGSEEGLAKVIWPVYSPSFVIPRLDRAIHSEILFACALHAVRILVFAGMTGELHFKNNKIIY